MVLALILCSIAIAAVLQVIIFGYLYIFMEGFNPYSVSGGLFFNTVLNLMVASIGITVAKGIIDDSF